MNYMCRCVLPVSPDVSVCAHTFAYGECARVCVDMWSHSHCRCPPQLVPSISWGSLALSWSSSIWLPLNSRDPPASVLHLQLQVTDFNRDWSWHVCTDTLATEPSSPALDIFLSFYVFYYHPVWLPPPSLFNAAWHSGKSRYCYLSVLLFNDWQRKLILRRPLANP